MIPRAATACHPVLREWGGRVRVSVNGHPQSYVTAYDVDAGTVERYETRFDTGQFIVRGDDYAIEMVRGAVRVWIE